MPLLNERCDDRYEMAVTLVLETTNLPFKEVSMLLLCGIPGPGKSCLSRSISEHYAAEESSLHFHKVVQIEYDAISH
jgi:ABC-type phosphate/phosphonate transport system ATPase subunit